MQMSEYRCPLLQEILLSRNSLAESYLQIPPVRTNATVTKGTEIWMHMSSAFLVYGKDKYPKGEINTLGIFYHQPPRIILLCT